MKLSLIINTKTNQVMLESEYRPQSGVVLAKDCKVLVQNFKG